VPEPSLHPPPARVVPSPYAPSPPSWRARRRFPSLLPFPSPGAYKKDRLSSAFPTPTSATSPSPSPSSIEPAPLRPPFAPVSSVLPSLVAFGQIALALKVRHSVTSLAHTCSSPIAPGDLAGDFTAASARHPPWTGHPRPPPVKLTPPPWPPTPARASPPLPRRKIELSMENRRGIPLAVEPRPTASPPHHRATPSAPPSSGMWARATAPSLRRPHAVSPLAGRVGRLPTRPRVRPRPTRPKFPPSRLT
jgi:hypothetical protein